MKVRKKALSIILSILIVLSMMPSAFAEEVSGTADTQNILSELVTDGSPGRNLTENDNKAELGDLDDNAQDVMSNKEQDRQNEKDGQNEESSDDDSTGEDVINVVNTLESELAEEETEADTVKIDFTAQAVNGFLCAPQLGVEVSEDLAESYGYIDEVETGVSALDVLVKAHQVVFEGDFTKENASTLLDVESGSIKTIFGQETMNCGFSVNGKQPHDNTLNQGYYTGYNVANAGIANNDLVEFYIYQDISGLDNCVEFTTDKTTGISSYDFSVGYGKNFYLYGYSIGWYGCIDNQTLQTKRVPIGGAQLCYINTTTGAKTDIEGIKSDDLGVVTLKFDTPGQYLVSAYIPDDSIEAGTTPAIMPLFRVNVYAAPVFESLNLYENQDAYNKGAEPIPMTPQFESAKLTGYTVTVPDYTSSLFVAAKAPGASDIVRGGGYTIGSQNYAVMYSNSWGGWSNSAYTSASFSKGYVDVFINHNGNKTTDYQIHVNQIATLKGLVVGGIMTPGFDKATENYSIYADSTKEGIDITATPYSNNYEITINGQKAVNGAAYTLIYNWNEDGTMSVPVKVSGAGKQENTYTLTLKKEPLESKPFIIKQPEGAVYVVGESAKDLSVRSSANGVLSYQWYKNNTNSVEGAEAIENATSYTYTPATVQVGTTYYFCRIINSQQGSGNETDTEMVSVAVYPDPTPVVTVKNEVPELPSDGYTYSDTKGYVYNVGDAAALLEVECTTAAEGGTWGGNWILSNSNANSGGSVLDTTWTITPKTDLGQVNDKGKWYYYQAKYTFNGKTYKTNSSNIYVFLKATAAPVNTISAQPKGAVYTQGDKAANLTVSLKSPVYGAITYQWYENTENSTIGGTPIVGATTSSYALGNPTEVGTKYYYCIITSALQGMSSQVTSDVAEIAVKERAPVDVPLAGSGTPNQPYQISTPEDFASVASLVAQGYSFEGMYLAIQNDITLSKDWTGIGMLKAGAANAGNGANILPFSGTLNGKDHTLTFAEGSKALLAYAREATVQNLNIYAPYMADYALLTNYVVDYGTDGNYNEGTGGSYAPGCPDTLNVTNVILKSGSSIRMGGFLGGYASGGNVCNFINCTVESNVKIGYNKTTDASSGLSNVGSFAGEVSGQFLNCVSYADVYGVNNVGGIGGVKGQSMGPYAYSNCEFYGTVIATGSCAGGIAAAGYNSISAPNTPCASVQNCIVAANITGTDKVGGILGGENGIAQNWGNAYIRNNVFSGNLTATGEGGIAGGIIGYFRSLNKTNIIENNYYYAEGVLRSIGRIDSVDTSCKTHETELCKNYFDTSVELPTEPTGVSKKNHNRTDDPLGTDSDTLGKKVTAEIMADGSLIPLLNDGEDSYKNWVQGQNGYPSHTVTKAVVTNLTVSGDYQEEYYIGDKLNLAGITFTAEWSDGTITNPTLDEGVTITGFDSSKRGLVTLTAAYGAVKTEFVVTILKTVTPEKNDINVSFTLLGDDIHDSEEDKNIHTLKKNNLETWIPKTSYTVDINATVEDLFRKALSAADINFEGTANNQYKTLYISGIQVPGTKNWLKEFTNGPRSGWMYTLNGTHPEVGVSQQFLEDGDKIVFHYTDDYTKEEGSDKWGGGSSSAGASGADAAQTLTPTAKVSGGKAETTLSLKDMKDAIAEVKSNSGDIVIAPKISGTVTSAQVTLNQDALNALSVQTSSKLIIQIPIGTVALSNSVLDSIVSQMTGKSITIAVEAVETKALTTEQQKAAGSNAVFDISVLSGQETISSFDGKSITISLPYALKDGEKAEGVTVWYLSNDGKLEKMTSQYDKTKGMTSFTTTHLSKYLVGYSAVWQNTFADVKEKDWFYGAVEHAAKNKLFNGLTASEFGPNDNMTRSMLVTVLYRLAGSPAVSGDNSFSDVKSGLWYTDAIVWANESGIVTGMGNGLFGTNSYVTREQLATILYNYAKYKSYDVTKTAELTRFADEAVVHAWATEATKWANAQGLLTGRTADTLAPGGSATRAEVATILKRFAEDIVK
ncbi:DUF4430 domain-containing protein [Aminipila butyrica]|uniref:DUF4430 domain-containing protein n=1 Tax=Aminipila butyrica TaxID=433296 RepID=A0A858BRT8_9FIRM|nr:S-layer homology domain-containing protein [Aminipila butyrica]QIB67835.1 DUF4430 domain-containing protein [Aminipila butyrica]